jgi:hypothetical protein
MLKNEKPVLVTKMGVWIAILLVAIVAAAVRIGGALREEHRERVDNRKYALAMSQSEIWTLQDVRPDPNASPSRMDVTYIFQSQSGAYSIHLAVSLANANKVWYDKVRPGDKVRFLPTVEVGDGLPDPPLSGYIRPEVQ